MTSKQTRAKLRKGFDGAPLRYRVLMVNQFTDADKKVIAKGLIKAITPGEATKLAPTPKDFDLPRDKRSKWSIAQLAPDVHLLKFKGLEVALYYQRQTSVIEPEINDPLPFGTLEKPEDVWVRLDLFSKSVRELVGYVANDMQESEFENRALQDEVNALRQINAHQEHQLKTLRTNLAALTAPVTKQGRKKK